MTDKNVNSEYVPLENSLGHRYLGKVVREHKNWLGRVNARIYQCYNVIGDRPFGYLAEYKGVVGPVTVKTSDFPDQSMDEALRRAKTVYRGRQNAKRQAARQSRVH